MPARARECSAISQPPPSVRANGAATTGFAAYFSAMFTCWKRWIGAIQLVPFAFLRGQQHHHQIRADAEVLAFVRDDHGVEILFGFLQAGVQHADVVLAERVHLAVELDAQHAIAQIDQRRAGVLLHHAVRRASDRRAR